MTADITPGATPGDLLPDVGELASLAERVRPRVAVVLGSGFAGLADVADDAESVAYAEVRAISAPPAQLAGHPGRLVFGTVSGTPVVLFQGRVHQYQGVSAREAAFPARVAAALGCETLVVTNAAGGISEKVSPGDIMLIADHINVTGANPLVGWPGPAGGAPFVPMRDAYDPALRELAREVAAEQGVPLAEGVYAGLLGPSFETQAEVQMFRTLGADVVGMSTVHEVIAARALGLRVLGVSFVANVAAGVGLTHDEVLNAGRAAERSMTALMVAILQRL